MVELQSEAWSCWFPTPCNTHTCHTHTGSGWNTKFLEQWVKITIPELKLVPITALIVKLRIWPQCEVTLFLRSYYMYTIELIPFLALFLFFLLQSWILLMFSTRCWGTVTLRWSPTVSQPSVRSLLPREEWSSTQKLHTISWIGQLCSKGHNNTHTHTECQCKFRCCGVVNLAQKINQCKLQTFHTWLMSASYAVCVSIQSLINMFNGVNRKWKEAFDIKFSDINQISPMPCCS